MRRIVILGGGFAGATLARRLSGRLPKGWEALLVSEESYTTYNPLLPEVVGASIFPEHVVAPLRQVIDVQRGLGFVMGRVTDLDLPGRSLGCETLAGPRRIAYDHLVLAFGSRARLDLIPGMAEHAMPLKTVGDALHIRNAVLRRLARIELETDAERRRRLGHFVVIGGGFSGVEVAGALADCLHDVARYYPGVRPEERRVTVVQDIGRLLPELPEELGVAAQRMLERRGVDIRLNAGAAWIGAEGVLLKDGGMLDAETVIATIGTRTNPLATEAGLPLERGRIRVDGAMRVPGVDDAWALGDCALVVNGRDGTPSPPTAQFAVRQARLLADNLLTAIAGGVPRDFTYKPRGAMAAIGHQRGVAEVFGVRLTGLPAWLLWRAYYLALMPTFGRRFRIFVEWSWGMLFPADITHIRFTRSAEHAPAPPIAPPIAQASAPAVPVA
ncbi:MAG TPA: NAD(P)/FAD-dependent oxidoreductase [Acetobacteraceae bacterium]|nr:NAD(P)/FAD-dependent oxidoreductase [Acetobacteraceae bacterium]